MIRVGPRAWVREDAILSVEVRAPGFQMPAWKVLTGMVPDASEGHEYPCDTEAQALEIAAEIRRQIDEWRNR